jgi:hypothetical protein
MTRRNVGSHAGTATVITDGELHWDAHDPARSIQLLDGDLHSLRGLPAEHRYGSAHRHRKPERDPPG